MGFLSSAYSAQVSPTVAISSRFGVNVYSYESDLSIGGEWWIGRKRGKREVVVEPSLLEQRVLQSKRAALQEASLREDRFEERVETITTNPTIPGARFDPPVHTPVEERDGVLKARISGDWVSLSFPTKREADKEVNSITIRSQDPKMSSLCRGHFGLAQSSETNPEYWAGSSVLLLIPLCSI